MTDVIVIGAGAAGLAAARALARSGRKVLLLEARDRAGGRMHSVRVPGAPVALELGAEFLHGTSRHTWELIEEASLRTRQMGGQRFCSEDGRLKPCPFFRDVESITSGIDRYRGPDLSFTEYLRKYAAEASERARKQATAYVEGFDAADPETVGVHWLRQTDRAAEEDGAEKTFSLDAGYTALVDHMAGQLDPALVEVRYSAAVRRIEWKPGSVKVHTAVGVFEGSQAIVTLPVAVLPTVTFVPPIQVHSVAGHQIASGAALRVSFVFHERFWEKLHDGLSRLSMMHSSDPSFPTWWTTAPAASTILTGWAGGSRAHRLSTRNEEEIAEEAKASLARVLLCAPELVEEQVVSVHTHNWQADPWSLGAYSFVRTGGLDAVKALASPVEGTLFFAGEATSVDGRTGLVHGAIETGKRAAREALSAWKGEQMPTKKAAKRAGAAKKAGKSPSTQAGEFVREEMHSLKHGGGRAKNPKQAIAIGLSEARREGVKLPPPKKGKASEATRKQAKRDSERGAAKGKTAGKKATKKAAKKTAAKKTAKKAAKKSA